MSSWIGIALFVLPVFSTAVYRSLLNKKIKKGPENSVQVKPFEQSTSTSETRPLSSSASATNTIADEPDIIVEKTVEFIPTSSVSKVQVREKAKIVIFYGGDLAYSVAQSVLKQSQDRHDISLENVKGIKTISADACQCICIFIIQTIENNQPIEDWTKLYSFIRRTSQTTAGILASLRFAVLGLGDTNLLLDRQTTTGKDANYCASFIDRKLAEVGATRVQTVCEADERTGFLEVDPWIAALLDCC